MSKLTLNKLLSRIVSFLNTDVNSKLYQTFKMELFAKIVNGFSAVNYFGIKLHLKCLTGF